MVRFYLLLLSYLIVWLLALEDSLSGSASSSDESDSDTVATLVNKSKKTIRAPSPESLSRSIPQTALVWFHSPPSTQIGLYKAIFPSGTPSTSYLSELKALQDNVEGGRQWAMFMVAGGHFAGAIVRVSRPGEEEDVTQDPRANKKRKKPIPDTEVLRHKTFHRYTSSSCPLLLQTFRLFIPFKLEESKVALSL
jgi:hypothetical protein